MAHRKFRSKNLGGSPLSIMATERPNGAPGDPVGRPKPPPHPQKSIGTCLCMCWPALLNGDSLGQRMGTVIKHAVGDVPQTNRKLYFLAGTSLKKMLLSPFHCTRWCIIQKWFKIVSSFSRRIFVNFTSSVILTLQIDSQAYASIWAL